MSEEVKPALRETAEELNVIRRREDGDALTRAYVLGVAEGVRRGGELARMCAGCALKPTG
jgi:hypothetical protein